MYEFCYDYIESKYGEKRRCITWIEIYIVYQKTDDISKDIAEDIKTTIMVIIFWNFTMF